MPSQAPLNPDEHGLLVVYPRHAPALTGLAEFEYVQLITLLDRVPEQLPEGAGQLVAGPVHAPGHGRGGRGVRLPVPGPAQPPWV
jgi:tRNA (Thr-GGU) A37 N-methylase